MTLSSDRFVRMIGELHEKHGLTDDQVSSALAGILIAICRRQGVDPLMFMHGAIEATRTTRCDHGYLLWEIADGTVTCEQCQRQNT